MIKKNLLIRLGSGNARSHGAGNKAALLDEARQARLPVPQGYLLTAEAWPDHVPDHLDLPGLVAVRSAFSAEDSPDSSLAGQFLTRLRVDPKDRRAFRAALHEVWQSGEGYAGPLRRDILILSMIEARHAGVAFTQRDFEDDLVNFTEGTAEGLVSGQVPAQVLEAPKLRIWERASPPPPIAPFLPRLQALLRGVRQVFGELDWDTEWADDGRRCWLIQVRPLTRAPRRNEVFTVANHKEILPDPPSPFMTSLILSCASDLFDYYRRFDPSLPLSRPLIEVFAGRPLINLSLLEDMMRILGLPPRLISESAGGASSRQDPPNLIRIVRKLPVFLRMAWAQLHCVAAARAAAEIIERTATAANSGSWRDLVEALRRVYVLLVQEMMSLTAAMSLPLALLRRSGSLAAHGCPHQTPATSMVREMEKLRAVVEGDDRALFELRQGRLPAHPGFLALWEAFLSRFGHRGIYESDIARPRFAEKPEDLLRSLSVAAAPPASPARKRTWRYWLTWPLCKLALRPMLARELLRDSAMRSFQSLRRKLLERAGEAVRQGTLPAADLLWLLDTVEVKALDEGWTLTPAMLAERRRRWEDYQQYRLPDLVHRCDDFDDYLISANGALERDQWSGVSLAAATLRGRAWVLREPAFELPHGFVPPQTLLVAPSLDAGWIPSLRLVAGAVVETGGDLSHGSIILRELGIPAVTNVRGIMDQVHTGDELILKAGAGKVERVLPGDAA